MPRPYNRTKEDNRGDRLIPLTAPDTQGDTVLIAGKVSPEMKAWVAAYAHQTSKNTSRIIREALELYRNHHTQQSHKRTP
ncbi:hypothetical protein [Leptodesmis sichuanensis]|uniref:hypothetical protein n=1 Tax=Leptodesmis sichuanensis TaxID=2906798 RepID=UPI001F32513C|nr:hypothetical protein [Leptodesmis sichuanensis]UIE40272.1 hypothetical protein KIK02_12465 [Leptodesmis sichuanensis A121]